MGKITNDRANEIRTTLTRIELAAMELQSHLRGSGLTARTQDIFGIVNSLRQQLLVVTDEGAEPAPAKQLLTD